MPLKTYLKTPKNFTQQRYEKLVIKESKKVLRYRDTPRKQPKDINKNKAPNVSNEEQSN